MARLKLYGQREVKEWSRENSRAWEVGGGAFGACKIGSKYQYWVLIVVPLLDDHIRYSSAPAYDDERSAIRGLKRWLKPLVRLADGDQPLTEITKSGTQYGWKFTWGDGLNRSYEVECCYKSRRLAVRDADRFTADLIEVARALKGDA